MNRTAQRSTLLPHHVFARARTIIFLLFAVALVAVLPSFAQQRTSGTGRKILVRVEPVYPPLARRLRLNGKVRVVATVSPAGKVVKTVARGGHPVLVQPALDAVAKFKWEPQSQETEETVEIQFEAAD